MPTEKPSGIDRATLAAHFVHTFHSTTPRGALEWPEGLIVFGNDGYKNEDGRAKREVEIVRGEMSAFNLQEPEFGLAGENDSTWVLVFSTHRGEGQYLATVSYRGIDRHMGDLGASVVEYAWYSSEADPENDKASVV